MLRVEALQQRLAVLQDAKLFNYVSLKGLYNGQMLLEDYIPLIQAEAVSDYRRYLHQRRYYH